MKDENTPEPSEQDKALARKWGKRLTRALEAQTKSGQEKRYKKNREYVRGDVGNDGQGGLVRTNIIHSNFAAILPQIYAKNPEIAVTPSEAAGDDEYPWLGGFCKTLQSVLNRKFIKGANLKKRAKAAIRGAMTTSIGWAKVSWQRDLRRDPIIENRLADTQDNLQRIRHLIAEIEDGGTGRDELEAQKAELEQQLAALEAKVEVSVVEGVVIDRPLSEDVFILDDTIYDFDGYEQAEAIAHRVWMTCEQYEEAFGKKPPKTANKYGQDKRESSRKADDDVSLVAVFEVWHRISSTVYTLCAGADEWARDPYQPDVTGKRFYPFFALAFNPVDGRMEPISDTELLVELQDEYNTTRTNFAEHRRENLPVRVYRKSGALTDGDIKSLSNRQAGQWIGVEGDPSTPLQNDIAILQNPPVDPGTYDVQPILRDAEMVLGAGDAAKGSINKAKTATEAEIMAQGLQSRIGERQDVVEDWIAEMARYAAELLLQMLTPEAVKQIAGKGAVWPQLTKDQVFDLVQIDIRAGSTGRPNQAKDREQWVQMLPQIQQSIQQIAQLRQGGQNDMAESVVKLMEETLRRFDERIDIEQFIPQKKEGEEPQAPQIPPALQQQMQQMQQAMQALQQEKDALVREMQDKARDYALKERELAIKDKEADTKRLTVVSPAMTADEIKALVLDTLRDVLMQPMHSDPEPMPEMHEQRPEMMGEMGQQMGQMGQMMGETPMPMNNGEMPQ